MKWLHPLGNTSHSMNGRLEDAYNLCDNEEYLIKKVVHGSFESKKKYCLETVLLSILHALIFFPHVQV